MNGSARGGEDYVPVAGRRLVFQEGEVSAEIRIPILANHRHRRDTNFTVRLSLPTQSPSNSTSDPTVIGGVSNVTVMIRDYDLTGPYFPALPELDNMVDGTRQHTAGVYYDLPLACITVSWKQLHSMEVSQSFFPFRLVMVTLMQPLTATGAFAGSRGLQTTRLCIHGRCLIMALSTLLWSSTPSLPRSTRDSWRLST